MSMEPDRKFYTLSDSLCQTIKNARVNSGFTQEDIAKLIGISRRSYARIESCNMTRIRVEVLEKLSSKLNFEIPDTSNNYNLRCSFSLSPELKNGLNYLKLKYHFDSLSETIQFCVEQVVKENFMNAVSQDIKNDIREALNNSYNYELEKLKKDNDMNQLILIYLSQTGALDLSKIKEDINNLVHKMSHASKY